VSATGPATGLDPALAFRTAVAPESAATGREPLLGGALRQDGDSTERIQEAIDTCPVDCIHWVPYEQLPALRAQLDEQEIQPLGLPSHGRRRRTLPRSVPPAP
jgi:ferredoxin